LFEHDLFGKPVSTFPDHALKNPGLKSQQPVRSLRAGFLLIVIFYRLSSSAAGSRRWRAWRLCDMSGGVEYYPCFFFLAGLAGSSGVSACGSNPI
jgi:hypothetical protein